MAKQETPAFEAPKVEKGIPISQKGELVNTMGDFLKNLEDGDSFLVKKERTPFWRDAAKTANVKITTRQVDSDTDRIYRLQAIVQPAPAAEAHWIDVQVPSQEA